MSFLGIDIGTSGAKAATFSRDGALLTLSYREYKNTSDSHTELDSQKIIDIIWDTVSETAAKTLNDPIEALSISSLGEAMTPVTSEREIIGNSILCSDTRGAEYIWEMLKQITREKLYEINPNIPGVQYSLPKLLWIKENQPDLYKRAYKFLLWGDLVIYLLGGEPLTSYSLANRTLLFDIKRRDWSEEILKIVEIDPEKLPRVVASGSIAGVVPDNIAEKLNLPGGVKIVVGGHDQCCNAFGAGAFEAGKTVCGLGTFECIAPVYNEFPKNPESFRRNGLNIEHYVLPGFYVSFLYNQSGSLVKWFRDTFAAAEKKERGDGDIYTALMSELPENPTNLFVLPHFETTGPPDFINNSCGIIIGLRTHTTRGEILKAIMESSTYYFIESIESLRNIGVVTSEFIGTGGGAKSNVWLQMKADILGFPFRRLEQTECGLVGTAMIAGLALKAWENPKQAVSCFVRTKALFEPDARRREIYLERYDMYKKIYPSLISASNLVSSML